MNPNFKTELYVETAHGKETIFYGLIDAVVLTTVRNGTEIYYVMDLYKGAIRVGQAKYPFYPQTLLDQLDPDLPILTISINALTLEHKEILMNQNVNYAK